MDKQVYYSDKGEAESYVSARSFEGAELLDIDPD